MLKIDIKFKCNGLEFTFNEETEQGKLHLFNTGEKILADKLFHVLAGVDKEYEGTVEGEGVDFSHTPQNNVLAIGDATMFIRGSVKRNIYKALRARQPKEIAKQQLQQIVEIHNLSDLENKRIRNLTDAELFRVAVARCHFREPHLVILNTCETYISECEEEIKNLWTKFSDCYKIQIT